MTRLGVVALLALVLAPVAREAPAHGTIVFVGVRITRAPGLVVYDAGGDRPRRLVAGRVTGVVVSSDGAFAYSETRQNEYVAVLHDARGSRVLGPGQVWGISPDGTTVAVRPDPGGIDLYDRDSGRVRLSLPAVDSFIGWAGGGLIYEVDLPGRTELHVLAGTDRTISTGTGPTVAAASPDGLWVASANNSSADVVRADGTSEHGISAGCVGGIAWAPDSTRFACSSPDASVLLVGVDGTHQSLPNRTDYSSPLSWSPDGAQLAYGAASGGVSVTTLATGATRELAAGARWPQWSPDGRTLSVIFGEGASVGVVPAAGGPMRVVARDANSAWLPDGRLLVRVDGHEVGQVATMLPDGRGLHFVPGATRATHPALSPDGSKLVYETLSDGPTDIVVCNSGGGHKRVLAHTGTGVTDVAWAPDGRRLAYVADDGIELIPASGGRARLVPHTDGAVNVAWSPDGTRLAFAVFGETTEIDVLGIDGRHRRVVVGKRRPLWTDGGIAWSPDGRKLAFALDYVLENGYDIPSLAVVDLSTRHISDLGYQLQNPTWSPDGRTLAADWYGQDVDLVNMAKTGQRTIAIGADPSWSP